MNKYFICKTTINRLAHMNVSVDGEKKDGANFILFLTLNLHKNSPFRFTIKYNGTQKGFITAFNSFVTAYDVESYAEKLLSTRDTRTNGPQSLVEIINYAESIGEVLITINKELKYLNAECATRDLIEEVKNLHNNTPNGQIVDADTILADAIESANHRINGLAEEVFNIWERSVNNGDEQELIEKMFELFTDMKFSEYLEKCTKEITSKMYFFKVVLNTEGDKNEDLYFRATTKFPSMPRIIKFCTAYAIHPFTGILEVTEIPEEEIEVMTYHPENIQVIE